jgi:hypothetical protein
MRFHHAALAAASLLLASLQCSAQTVLTDVTLFHSDSGGTYLGDQGWDTATAGGAFKVWLKEGGIAGSSFLNGAGGGVSPALVLAPGSYSIGLFAEPGGYVGYHGLNLFFDGAWQPGISAIAPDHTAPSAASEFYSNGAASTLGFAGSPGMPASASLSYTSGGVTVTVTEFYLGSPDLFSLDEVSGYSPSPGGSMDRVGLLTLNVTAVPEPGSLAMIAGLGLTGFAAWRRRTVARAARKNEV